jgi:glycosyltransferase involved in cell wall biosynthesis
MNDEPVYSVVIPVYREGDHLKVVLRIIQQELDSLQSLYELVLVDDGSPDNTWDVIRELSRHYPMLRALRLSRNFGKEYALCAGLEIAKGKAVIVMDGDLQHPPKLIPEMARIWRESDTKIVEAVKVTRGKESILGKLGANFFYAFITNLSGYNLKGASDYKLLDRKVVNAWLQMGERNLFFRGMTAWLGFQRVQIPFEVPDRYAGQSSWSFLKLVKLAVTGVTAFTSLPLQFVTFTGVIFLIFAVFIGVQTLFLKLTGQAVSGFTTVIILILIIGSLIMISLGIIGEYIARIYEEVKDRPRYVIADHIDGFVQKQKNNKYNDKEIS